MIVKLASLIPPFTAPIDENRFVDWLIDARPGEAVVYYRGQLGHDRMPSARVLSASARIELDAVADRILVAHAQGLVIPVQRRLGPCDWLYLAIKTVRCKPPARRADTPHLMFIAGDGVPTSWPALALAA
jgi:hypothetical protein